MVFSLVWYERNFFNFLTNRDKFDSFFTVKDAPVCESVRLKQTNFRRKILSLVTLSFKTYISPLIRILPLKGYCLR